LGRLNEHDPLYSLENEEIESRKKLKKDRRKKKFKKKKRREKKRKKLNL